MPFEVASLARGILRRKRGSVAIQMGLLMTVLIGMVALGTEITFAYAKHRQLQMFADAAAYSAAIAERNGYPNRELEAQSVVSELAIANINNYANDVTVVVNTPSPGAVEAIVSQPQTLGMVNLVCTWYGGCPNIIAGLFNVSARAVAVTTAAGSYCVLALNGTASGAVTTQGTATVNLTGCSLAVESKSASSIRVSGGGTINAEKVTTVGGIDLSGGGIINAPDGVVTNSTATFNDPYDTIPVPTVSGNCPNNPVVLNSGCNFSNLTLESGKTLTLNSGSAIGSGVYVINGNLTVNGGASLYGNGVTIVVTGQIKINGGANVSITAPTTGVTQGIAFFDKGSGTSAFEGGAGQTIVGAVYLPKQTVKYAGGNVLAETKCMELIANTITFTGNSNFALDCTGRPIGDIGGNLVKLVE